MAYLFLLITVVGWAGAWLTARAAAHELPALTVAAGRFVVAALALVPAWLALERRRRVSLGAREWAVLLGMSATGIAGYTVLFMEGVARAPASDGAVITPGLAGVFSMAMARLLNGERPARRAVFGAALSSAGTFLVGLSALRAAPAGSARFEGDLIYAASALLWGVYTALGQRLARAVPPVTGVLLASALGVVLLAPFVLVVDGVPRPLEWSALAVLNVVYLGLGATAIAFVTWYLAIRMLGTQRAAPALGLVPFLGVLGAAAVLGERLVGLQAAGGALVVAGIVLASARRRSAPA